MDTQFVKLFEPTHQIKSFVMIICVVVFLVVLSFRFDRDIFLNSLSILVLCLISGGLNTLIGMRQKIIISPHQVIRKNGFWTSTIPMSAICVVEADIKKGLPPELVIKTDQSTYRIGQELHKTQITEAVVCIFEQIRRHYPENLAKINPDMKQKEQQAVADFWRN